MEFRHLRCFLAAAEELHFARAAERLHIEQSPLSRTTKDLEEDLGEQLFVRTSRSTRLTRAGKLLLEHVPRVFTALQQARDSVKAATNGFHSQLRIALSDGIMPSRLPSLLALCRQEEPEVEIHSIHSSRLCRVYQLSRLSENNLPGGSAFPQHRQRPAPGRRPMHSSGFHIDAGAATQASLYRNG